MTIDREITLLVERLVAAKIREFVRTHLPVKITSFDPELNTAEVQPVNRELRIGDAKNPTTSDQPLLTDVLVQQIGSGKLMISVPPAAGSYGFVHVADRDIKTWAVAGGTVDPESMRHHDRSDGVLTVGLYPLIEDGDNGKLPAAIATDRISLRTRSGKTEISVLADESIAINVNEGKATLTIDKDGNLSLSVAGDLDISADGSITVSGAVDVNGNLTVDK